VIQFSTGHVGVHALRSLIERPDVELVGVHASSPSKLGKDAAELCGLAGETGVVSTDDVDALVALGADCVVYTSQAESRPQAAIEELTAFLGAGTNVVASSLVWLVYPPHADAWLREPLEAACVRGGSTMYVNGIDPGFSGDLLPFAALSLTERADTITVQEICDYGSYDDAEFTGVSFGFGTTPDVVPMLFLPGVLASIWGGPVRLLADELGVVVDELRERHETWTAVEPIDCTMMRVEPGQVAVHRIETRNDSASEAHEQRIGSEALQAKDPMLAHNEHVEEHPELGLLHLSRHSGIDFSVFPLDEPIHSALKYHHNEIWRYRPAGSYIPAAPGSATPRASSSRTPPAARACRTLTAS